MKITISQSLCAASVELDAAQKALTDVLTVIERARAYGVAISPALQAVSTTLAEQYAAACATYKRELAAQTMRPSRPSMRLVDSFGSTSGALLAIA